MSRKDLPRVASFDQWQEARDQLMVKEKAHTRAGDALAAERKRLPMVQVDGQTLVEGAAGNVPFIDLFQGRDELVIYKHMWHDGAPHQGQCEGCTTTAWHLQDTTYLNARGVSFALVTEGAWAEVEPYLRFMGYKQPWYSVRGIEGPIGDDMGSLATFVRDGDNVYLTYQTTGRGNEVANPTFGLLDMTVRGRGEEWEDTPERWPQGQKSCWYWRLNADSNPSWGEDSRPTPQWGRPGAGPVTTLGRKGHCH